MRPLLGNLHSLRDRLEGRLNKLAHFSEIVGYTIKGIAAKVDVE